MQHFFKCELNVNNVNVACYVAPGSGATIHNNRPSHGLALHLSGEKEYVFDNGKRLTVKKNDIIFLPKSSNYEVLIKQPGDCYAINFELSNQDSFPPFAFSAKNKQGILSSFQSAEKVWKRKEPGYILKCKAELYTILYHLQSDFLTEYAPLFKRELLSPALSYIHENYTTELINIAKLSKLCKISHEYFRRLFRTFYGCTPIQYINELKLAHAKSLISSGLYSVTEAALKSGFSDMSHFSRFFKQRTGIPPSLYLK